jgi:hypothetical protein
MISEKDFQQVTNKVIDKLEGGYYHPQMLKDGRIPYDSRYESSGETMFGIDRLNGGTINTSAAGQQFWAEIDKAGAKSNWKWLYLGGDKNAKLKELAGKAIYPFYVKNSQTYLTPKAQQLVDSDPRLIFHFAYATWNGPGWFKKFAAKINEEADKGITSTDTLSNVAVQTRTDSTSSLIRQGGNKIAGFINELKTLPVGGETKPRTLGTSKTPEQKQQSKSHILTIGITVVLIVAVFILYKQLKKK